RDRNVTGVQTCALPIFLLCLLFLQPVADLLDYGSHPEFIAMMAVVVALDSFQCIPFAYLRYKKRPIKFAAIKLFSIVGGIGLNEIGRASCREGWWIAVV